MRHLDPYRRTKSSGSLDSSDSHQIQVTNRCCFCRRMYQDSRYMLSARMLLISIQEPFCTNQRTTKRWPAHRRCPQRRLWITYWQRRRNGRHPEHPERHLWRRSCKCETRGRHWHPQRLIASGLPQVAAVASANTRSISDGRSTGLRLLDRK